MIKLLLKIKHSLPFIWSIIEYFNGLYVKLFFGKRIKKNIQKEINDTVYEYQIKSLEKSDMQELADFFSRQPEKAFYYFKPHKFDTKSLVRLNKNGSIYMLGIYDNKILIGYFFLRCFANKKSFRGKIVDFEHYGKGISTKMGLFTTNVALKSGFRLFETVSKNNIASLKSSQAGTPIKIIEELPNNYLYIECLKK